MSGAESLLCEILNCGPSDLAAFDDVGYDWGEIVERMAQEQMSVKDLTFNGLLGMVFQLGVEDLDCVVRDRICDLEAIREERKLTQREKNELEELLGLSPVDDFSAALNFLDTHISLKHMDVYRRYFWEAISEFEQNTGFNFPPESER